MHTRHWILNEIKIQGLWLIVGCLISLLPGEQRAVTTWWCVSFLSIMDFKQCLYWMSFEDKSGSISLVLAVREWWSKFFWKKNTRILQIFKNSLVIIWYNQRALSYNTKNNTTPSDTTKPRIWVCSTYQNHISLENFLKKIKEYFSKFIIWNFETFLKMFTLKFSRADMILFRLAKSH